MNIPRLATIGLLLVLCMAGSRRFKTLFNPVVIVCAPWAGMLFGQQLFGSVFPFSGTAALMVGLAALAFTAGALAPSLQFGRALEPTDVTLRLRPHATLLWVAVSWSLIVVAAANFGIFLYYGVGLGVGRVQGGGFVIYALYDAIQGSSWGWIQRGLQIAVYIGGALFAFETVRLRRIGLRTGLFLGIVMFQGWIVSNRQPTFLLLSIFAVTWSMMFAWKLRRPSLRHVVTIGVVLVLGAIFYWYTSARRHGGQMSGFRLALDLGTTFLGPPAAFSVHLQTTSGWHVGGLTGITIQGPLELFGLAHRGVAPIAPLAGFTVETNVFSGLWMLLEEVGIAGMAAVLAALGSVMTALVASFYRRPNMLKAAIGASLYLLLLWLPETFMSYYVFWSVQLVAVAVLGSLVYSVRVVAPATHPPPGRRLPLRE